MISFKSKDNIFIVLEPGNIKKMKNLEPLQITIPKGCTRVGLVITPDIQAFESKLGTLTMPTPEALQNLLEECKSLPELERLTIIDGVDRKVN